MPEPRKRPRPKPKKLQPKYPDLQAGLQRIGLPDVVDEGDGYSHPIYHEVLSEMLAATK